MYIDVDTHMSMFVYVYTYVYAYMYTYVKPFICVHICICIYTYVYIALFGTVSTSAPGPHLPGKQRPHGVRNASALRLPATGNRRRTKWLKLGPTHVFISVHV